jgi:hypothetical protein
MREICMSGLTSGDRRRSYTSGGDAKAPPRIHREANATAPVLDSTHLDAAVFEEHDQAGPVPYRVADGLRQIGDGGHTADMILQPPMQGFHDRSTSLLPHLLAVVGGVTADVGLDRIELADAHQHLGGKRRLGGDIEVVEGPPHVGPAERKAYCVVSATSGQPLEPGISVDLEDAAEPG